MKAQEKLKACTAKGACAEVTALLDSGANLSFISKELAEELGYRERTDMDNVRLAVDPFEVKPVGDIVLDITIGACRVETPKVFRVIPGLRSKVVIGRDIMDAEDVKIVLSDKAPRVERCAPETPVLMSAP